MSVRPVYVAGEWRPGRGDVYASRYPADDSVNAELAAASVADVEEAIAAADAAWRRSDWRDLKPHERASVLYRISTLIRERAEELAHRAVIKVIFPTLLCILPSLFVVILGPAAMRIYDHLIGPGGVMHR